MSNISQYHRLAFLTTTNIAASTSGGVGGDGSTGDALALSTGGSTGTGTSTSGPGGYPLASTGFDIRGTDGVRFTAIFRSASTGGGAGTSGIATLQIYTAPSSTTAATSWVALKDAYAIGYSSASFALSVDVYRPKLPTGNFALGAICQVPSSSSVLLGVVASGYANKSYPTANSTAINTASGTQVVANTVSVGATT